ncbi:Bug family tripartite tricarboxylate transporter substrate binding protein [Xanthomonas axonopodis]|uniref:Bug family tripartite tricarboxylate transporter substrate binding protein n=1 Tax=Xanthomonas axonopodis TaxID=53413 RepID=UPI003558A83D
MSIFKLRILAFFSSLLMSTFVAAESPSWPAKPIQVVVPYAAGGTLDAIVRILAVDMSKDLKQSIVVVNSPGAGGSIGVRRVRHSTPDGYTVLAGTISDVVLASLSDTSAGYSSADLTAVGAIGQNGVAIIGRGDLPAEDMASLLALAKSAPRALTYGSSGAPGSFQHLAMESIKSRAQIDMPFVPYKGAAQVTADLLGGHLDLGVLGLPSLLPHIASGKLKVYAVVSAKRDPIAPSIPSVSETAGLESVNFSFWNGLFVPNGTPAAIVNRLHQSLVSTLQKTTVVDALRRSGVDVTVSSSPAEFSAYVKAQEQSFATMLRDRGLGASQPAASKR